MRETTRLGEMKELSSRCIFIGLAALIWVVGVILNCIDMGLGNSEEFEEVAEEEKMTNDFSITNDKSDEIFHLVIIPKITYQLAGATVNMADTTIDKDGTDDGVQEELESTPYIDATNKEIHELACLIWLEGRGESVECQEAIASVVVNRYTTNPDKYDNLLDVIYEKNQFSPAHLIYRTEPTEVQIEAARKVVTEGPTIPEYVTFFRAHYYHKWKNQVPYKCMGSTYFSYDKELRKRLENPEVIK